VSSGGPKTEEKGPEWVDNVAQQTLLEAGRERAEWKKKSKEGEEEGKKELQA